MGEKLKIKQELLRKAIHISTSVIPLLYFYGTAGEHIFFVCVFLSTGFLVADLMRINFALAGKYFLLIFSKLLRRKEKAKELTGATYLFISMTVTVYFFPREAAIPAMMFATLADPVAALTGRKFGSKPFRGKTLEGLAGFFLCASAIVIFMTGFSYAGIGVALLAAIIEFLPLKINDNVLVPVSSAILFSLIQ